MDSTDIQVNLERVIQARHHDPFSVLGRHTVDGRQVVRAYLPAASEVTLAEIRQPLRRLPGTDLFEWEGELGSVPERYRLSWLDADRRRHSDYDPYCFLPQLSDYDLYLFGEGKHWRAYQFMGALRRLQQRGLQ